jgi:class 3 adenylate cyclase/tetratricopeptide (TPR) repeat protein
MSACPRCGRENPADARFCSACGAGLGTHVIDEVRKTVTVVFCDLVGSTSLGERLDAEFVRGAIGRYFEAARSALERHGGTVEKFIGDAVMAVFGIPGLHEDDALRAVRAAAELRDALGALARDVEGELGARLQARIGVATGEVVAGDPSSGQAFVTGDAVNVAARLEQAAGPDQILLDERTFELVREAVRADATGPLDLKGKGAPVHAWELLGVLADAPASARSLDSPFVGREAEIGLLRQALERASASRSCELCTVIGPPGIGKSRLAREFIATDGQDHRAVIGRCLPYGEGITYRPLTEIVRQLAGGELRIEDLLDGDESAPLISERIAGAIGAAESPGPAEETFWAFRKLFEALARERPLVLVVDELHWAEPTLLDLLEYLVTFTADAPVMLLCLARPELLDARPSWAAPRSNATLVTIEPLAAEASSVLIESAARMRGLSAEGLERIAAAAEGNPLFLEQMLAHRAVDGTGEPAVPATLQALLAARIDRLDPDERAVLMCAAVEGPTFHRGALADLLPPPARENIGQRLMALVRKDLIRPDRSEFPGDDGFRFGHALIRDAAYEAAPKGLRAEAHEGYAGWLERRAGERVREYDEILGHHLEAAHRYRTELGRPDPELATRAAERLAAAGERALARGDVPAAVNLLERAAALATPPPARLLLALGIARLEAGDLEEADRTLSEAIGLAEGQGDVRLAVRGTLERSRLRMFTGGAGPEQMRSEAERAIAVFDRLGDEEGLAKAWLHLVDAHNFRSEMSEMEAAAEQALVHARRAGGARDEADALFWRFTGALYGERPVPEGIELCERALAEVDAPMAVVGLLEILAALRVRNGEVADGRELYENADRMYRELGMRMRAAVNLQCRGTSELATGSDREAEAVFRRSVEEYLEIGERSTCSTAAAELALALCAQGRHEEAARFLDTSEELTHPDDRWNQVLIPSGRARVLAAQGEIEAAIPLAERAVSVAAELDVPELRVDALIALAEVLSREGRAPEVAAVLREALDLRERKGNRPGAERIRERLGAFASTSSTS